MVLEAVIKRQELNKLEFQAVQRSQDIVEAGKQQAEALQKVASANNFATAFEIDYRSSRDLTADQKSSSAGGLATAQDWILAEHYYQKMVEYRQIEREAQQQANYFAQTRKTAEDQLTLINQTKTTEQENLAKLNEKLATTQEEINTLQQELSITQSRINTLD